jgi:hypothetical protein
MIEEDYKDPLKWWRANEVHFFYVGFVAQQVLGIINFQNLGQQNV